MGCLNTSPEKSQDKRLNDELKQAKQDDRFINKLLFLGAGGSGKSTIFKQLKKIHGSGWDTEYLMSFMQYIRIQVLEQMKLAVDCVAVMAEAELSNEYGDDYKIPDDFNPYSKLSNDAQDAAKTMKHLIVHESTLDEATAKPCKLLWKEAVVKDIYENRAITTLEDTSAYFWDKIDDLIKPDYVPNETDILLVRLRSTGVQEQKFSVKGTTFHLFDVGGQKSERKKWIHCFENVTAMIFVVSLSCYDEVMFEDEKMNSMVDSLALFEKICNDKWFTKTSVILFLNKQDLFAQKLQDSKAITLCPDFEDYEGDGKSFEETTEYIKSKFVAKNERKTKTIYTHLTCATDKNNVEKVFYDVQSIVIESALMAQSLLSDNTDAAV